MNNGLGEQVYEIILQIAENLVDDNYSLVALKLVNHWLYDVLSFNKSIALKRMTFFETRFPRQVEQDAQKLLSKLDGFANKKYKKLNPQEKEQLKHTVWQKLQKIRITPALYDNYRSREKLHSELAELEKLQSELKLLGSTNIGGTTYISNGHAKLAGLFLIAFIFGVALCLFNPFIINTTDKTPPVSRFVFGAINLSQHVITMGLSTVITFSVTLVLLLKLGRDAKRKIKQTNNQKSKIKLQLAALKTDLAALKTKSPLISSVESQQASTNAPPTPK